VVTRKQLEQAMYGVDRLTASNSIEVHIHNLRAKISGLPIKSIRGVGYALGQQP
jgi:DNA-binding response OmpR family regulator